MAEQIAQYWPVHKPLGTPAFPAPGNTCGCPSLAVCDEPDVIACDRHGLLKKKKTTLIFCSVPRYLLEDVGRGSTDPFMISDYTHGEKKAKNPQVLLHVADFCLVPELGPLLPAGGWYTGPTYRPKNVLLTNTLEIIEKIWGMCVDACRTQAGVACKFLIML